MAEYTVEVLSTAQKELKWLAPAVVERVYSRLEALRSNPRPPGCKKLKGGEKEWRIRVGEYRVVYTVDDPKRQVEVTRIRHRSEVYRR